MSPYGSLPVVIAVTTVETVISCHSSFLPSLSLSIYICTYITYSLYLSLCLSLSLFLRNLRFKVTCSTGHVSTHSLWTILLPRRMCDKHRNYISYYLHRKVIYNEIKLIVKFTWKKKLIKIWTSRNYRIRAQYAQ